MGNEDKYKLTWRIKVKNTENHQFPQVWDQVTFVGTAKEIWKEFWDEAIYLSEKEKIEITAKDCVQNDILPKYNVDEKGLITTIIELNKFFKWAKDEATAHEYIEALKAALRERWIKWTPDWEITCFVDWSNIFSPRFKLEETEEKRAETCAKILKEIFEENKGEETFFNIYTTEKWRQAIKKFTEWKETDLDDKTMAFMKYLKEALNDLWLNFYMPSTSYFFGKNEQGRWLNVYSIDTTQDSSNKHPQ